MTKKILSIAAALFFCGSAFAQGGVGYSLPRTALEFTVEAECESFHAGPYARYAAKYLGVNAREQDSRTYTLTSIKVRALAEADQQTRYTYFPTTNALPVMLQLTSQGLVAGPEGAFSADNQWKYPAQPQADFASKGMPANLTSESNVLYGNGRAVSQEVTVQKSDEMKAREVAERIFEIRENRYRILVGDTDATYSGEAMAAAVDALDRMEKENMALFLGYSDKGVQQAVFEIVPDPANASQTYVAFRLSDEYGLLGAESFDGKPYYLQLVPEGISAPAVAGKGAKPAQTIRYRVPAICLLTVGDGAESVLTMRVPVYQLGSTEEYPVYGK